MGRISEENVFESNNLQNPDIEEDSFDFYGRFLNDEWIVFKSFEARLILVDRKNMKAIGELSPPNYDNKSGEYIVSFEVLDGNRLLVQHGNSTLTIYSFPSQK